MSPKFDDRKGAEKSFGMGKWRKSQKVLREKKQSPDYVPKEKIGFQERPVDVPDEYYKENMKQHPKSCATTPKLSRAKNKSGRFSRANKGTQSVPTRRMKNFVPYDV